MDHTRGEKRLREQKVRSTSVGFSSDGDGFEDVEAIESRTDNHARYLWMPMHLFDIFLSLMDEKQLGRNTLQLSLRVCVPRRSVFGIFLNGQVPYSDLVVRTRSDKGTVFGGVPLDRCNWRFVPVEYCYW